MASRGDGIYQRGRTWWPLVIGLFLGVATAAEAGFERGDWLNLYDSSDKLTKSVAVAYAYGMANGLTIGEAMDCTGVEMSGEDLAATVAVFVRKGFDLRLAVPMALTVHKCRTVPGGALGRTR